MSYVAVVGNLSEGFKVIGPFDYGGDAFDAAEQDNGHDQIWVMSLDMNHSNKWSNPLLQFARLIAEVEAAGGFTRELILALRASMDLKAGDIQDLIDRAQSMFDEAKENV